MLKTGYGATTLKDIVDNSYTNSGQRVKLTTISCANWNFAYKFFSTFFRIVGGGARRLIIKRPKFRKFEKSASMMEKKAEIFVNFSENLSQIFDGHKTTLAYLIGFQNRPTNEWNVFNAVFVDPLTPDLVEFKSTLENQLPAGFEVIGVWNTDFTSEEIILEWLELKSLSQDFKDIITVASSADDIKSKTILPEHVRLLNVESAVFYNEGLRAVNWKRADSLHKRTLSFRIACDLHVVIRLLEGVTEHESANEITRAFENLEDRFSSKSDHEEHVNNDINMYKTLKGNLLLNFSATDDEFCMGEKLGPESTCYDLWRHVQTDEKISKRKELTFSQDVIDLKLLHNVSNRRSNDKSAPYVPVIHYEMSEFYSCTIPLKLNAMAVCSQDTKIADLADIFRISLLRQIKCAKKCARSFSDFQDKKNIPIPESFVFYVEPMRQFLIEFYPKNCSTDSLKQFRRNICSTWNLPIDRPLITRQNSYVFPSEAGVYLRNVHEFVPTLVGGGGAADQGTMSIVQGPYQYHHYMQDNMNDNGWGCAYRSFQTIWSWFLLQGYIDKPVPSHREIQQALVDIGDRPANFVGSRQWIGSLELSFCLSHLLQIESKILNISSGAELVSKVRELMKHFDTEGTPIMIGGGVLAHTILGVYFNEETGQAKFLVLDPHYTGDENIKTIVDKGWCGWKQPSFWSEGAFYNLLLPQRPTGVF